MTAPFVLFDDGLEGTLRHYRDPDRVIVARDAAEVPGALAAMEAARAAGLHLAGYAAYELGYVLEPRLAPLLPRDRRGPLLAFGAFGPPSGAFDLPPPVASLSPPVPDWDAGAYARRFAAVQDYIRAGDVYQVNLTFPLRARLAGDALAQYAAMRARQPAACGAVVALGAGPLLLSASPEIFFTLAPDGVIETRPMKGTARRGADAAEDAALRAWLAADAKNRAENLMIVDMLRNDLGRVCETGSVHVPALFAVETYPTLHQMISRVAGRLAPGADLAAILGALMPCGSVTGAPKVRAMEIIRELERGPREAYCGAIGWIAPDGSMRFGVGIRTLSVFPDGEAVFPVGSGLVADSDVADEYAECLLKARFLAARSGGEGTTHS